MALQPLLPELGDDLVREILLRLRRSSVPPPRLRRMQALAPHPRRPRIPAPPPRAPPDAPRPRLPPYREGRRALRLPLRLHRPRLPPPRRPRPPGLARPRLPPRPRPLRHPSTRQWRPGDLGLHRLEPLDRFRLLPRLSPPPTDRVRFNAAVLCDAAAVGCDHCGCHRGPFRVIFLFTTSTHTSARVYSSKMDDWRKLISIRHPHVYVDSIPSPSALVGDALYFRGLENYGFEYQLSDQHLSVIYQPRSCMIGGIFISLMSADGGELRFANLLEDPLHLCLWSMEIASNGRARWVQVRAINLETLLPEGALLPRFASANVTGFAEGTDVIFVVVYKYANHRGDVYMVQLNSGRTTKVLEGYSYISPYTSFCIPVIDAASTGEEPLEGVLSA